VQGAILSEWPLGTPARAANFPQRNRLIAGLVSGVVIVEAAMRSGSLITARLANDMGRDIFALPGSIHAPLSRGCHRIIKQGAKLVETSDEILEELGFARRPAVRAATSSKQTIPWDSNPDSPQAPPANPLDPDAQRLLAALGHSPTTLEILASRTEMEDAALQTALLRLELAGQVSVLPGGRYMRASHGAPALT
jgi:DNA processing protein